jgi:hypothetical protein
MFPFQETFHGGACGGFALGRYLKLAGGADSGLEGGLRGCVGYQEERGEIREAERVVPLISYMQVTQN